MSSRLSYRVPRLLCALTFAAAPAVAQETDTLTPADTLAPADTVEAAPLLREEPRLTWLGDTLDAADSLGFTEAIEIPPDSLLDPYTVSRPGARPACPQASQ